MSRDHWDAILASTPLNATAGAVTSKGYQYEPAVKVACLEWDAPPKIGLVTRTHLRNASFTDFTGKKYGRLTVVGMLAEQPTSGTDKGAQWVCRCACGCFVARRAKSVRKADPEDRCTKCRHTAFLARAASGEHARKRAESSKAQKWTDAAPSPTTVKEPR